MTPEQLTLSILKLAFSGRLVEQKNDEKITDNTSFDLKEPPFIIPSKWKWNTISGCSELFTGNSISETEKKSKYTGLNKGFDYIGTKDVLFDHTIVYDNGVRIPFTNDFKKAPEGSILLCIEGGSAGRKIAILNKDVCFGNKLCMFNAKTIYNKYLYFFLQSKEFKSAFADNVSGIIGGVSINKIKKMYIPIPPLEEQKRIVTKIEELLPLINKYEKAWTKLEKFNSDFPLKMEKSILEYAIQGKLVKQRSNEGTGEDLLKKLENSNFKTDYKVKEKHILEIKKEDIPFDAPKNWTWVRLGSVCVIARGGSPRPINAYLTNDKDGLNWIKIGDTEKNGKYITSVKQKIKKEGLNKTREVHPGDFLLTNSMSFGRPYITKINGCVHDGWLIISQQEKIFDQDFLYYLLSSGYAYNQFSGKVSGAVVKNLNSDKVANSIFPLPPLKEQERIVAKIEELLSLCKQLIKE